MELDPERPQIHLVALPHTQLTKAYDWCAYTAKLRRFTHILTMAGYTPVVYGPDEHECAPGTIYVPIVGEAERKEWFGAAQWDSTRVFDAWDADAVHWRAMNARAGVAIAAHWKPGDILGLIAGRCQQTIAELVRAAHPAPVVWEWGIGYSGVLADTHHTYESYAWAHHVAGLSHHDDVRFYDSVVPNCFDVDDFTPSSTHGDYLLYMGRPTARKGLPVITEIAKRTDLPVKIAGQPGADIPGTEYVGLVTGTEKAELLAGARALLAPTTYLEPFGGVAVEAMMSGTPVITTDWGAFCVPRDAEVLTRRGWMLHGQVIAGDETLGYDPDTKRLAWTPIERVNVFQDQPTTEYRNRNWVVRTTAGHRWSVRRKGGPDGHRDDVAAFEELRSGDRARLAAEGPDGRLDLSEQEAAVIAWLLTDGSVETVMKDGVRWSYDWEVDRPSLIGKPRIWQSKPEGLQALRAALVGVPHTDALKGSKLPAHYHPARVFRLDPSYVRSIAERARIHETGLSGFVADLSREARRAFLEACFAAEGHRASRGSTRLISQNKGSFLDAIVLCAYLCGFRPTLSKNGERCMSVALCNPYIVPQRLHVAPGRIEDVWCPTTGLGTWTMRFGDHVVLTGNTETVVHGATGFRCHTLAEFLRAVDDVTTLDRAVITAYAQNRFGLRAGATMYDEVIQRLLTLYGEGWYTPI